MNNRLVAHLEAQLNDYLAELTTIAGMDSYSFEPEDVNHVVDWLETRLLALGCTVERYSQPTAGDNLRADKFGSGVGRITLLGHSDTVFPRGTAAQHPLTFQGDAILGPGTCDMKAELLTGIYAVEALDALGFRDYERITFGAYPLIASNRREFLAYTCCEGISPLLYCFDIGRRIDHPALLVISM